MTGRRGGRILTTCLLAVMCALPATAIGASPFHQVVAYTEGQIESDGVRYAFVATHTGAPLMFDTRRGRTFRPAPPVPDCRYGGIGGGLAFWNCPPPRRTLITDLATGRSWEPAGTEQVDAMTGVYYSCGLYGIGRHWLEFFCGASMGPRDQWYLNHRTGKIADLSGVNPRRPYLVDLNYDGLVRYICPSVLGPDVSTFSPPFSLLFDNDDTPGLWLRRCGEEQEETLSRCRSALCVTPQLGSRYVTWAEHELVLAYLPRIERRVPIGRAGGLNRYSAVEAVVHTCNRVFAQWAHTVYVARFEPRRGAPPCQAGG